MNFLNKLADIMILNILFIVFSIPIVTIGASYTAAYYMGYKMVKDEETYIVKGFWKAFKENFVQSTIMWLIIMVVAVVLVFDYRILLYSGMEFAQWMKIAMITATVVILMGVSFIFPMQARYTNTIKNTVKNAFLMALAHIPTSFALIVIYALPVVVYYFIPQTFAALFLLAMGLIIFGQSFLLMKIFTKYEEKLGLSAEKEFGEDEKGSGIFAGSDKLEKEMKAEKAVK
jgi:uncharacterized membrane protein YesL